MPRLFTAALALLLAGCAATPGPAPVSSETTTAGTEQLSDQDLQAKWWTWAASSPENRSPVVDDTGQWCAENQPEDVWFFAGTFGGTVDRRCKMPAGRPLAGPALNLMSTAEGCAQFMADAKGSVTLDGQLLELRRIAPVAVAYQAARGNVVGQREGRVTGQGCGLWAWIPPLKSGEHELLVKGSSGTFSTTARYLFTVSSAG
ncbi:signal protein [Lentzea cavernae]|uniref:signal protein n=1 Tax=Lentzea cavernae TaxID=2020703 RepID=UPI00174BDFA6|nr:signal protein [Lentzea cavernae]